MDFKALELAIQQISRFTTSKKKNIENIWISNFLKWSINLNSNYYCFLNNETMVICSILLILLIKN